MSQFLALCSWTFRLCNAKNYVAGQALYVWSNIEALSCNRFFLQWKNNKLTHSECVFVALVIQHSMRMRHILICSLPRWTIFSHIIS